MLNLITDSSILEQIQQNSNIKYIQNPDKQFDDIIDDIIKTEQADEKSRSAMNYLAEIASKIDKSPLTKSGTHIISKFTHQPVSVKYLSTGAKTAFICYITGENHSSDIVNLTGCGGNATEFIIRTLQDKDINLFIQHYELPLSKGYKIQINGGVVKELDWGVIGH